MYKKNINRIVLFFKTKKAALKANSFKVKTITDPAILATHAAEDIPKLIKKQGDNEIRKKSLIQAYQRISSVLVVTRQELDALAPEEAARLRLMVARSASGRD